MEILPLYISGGASIFIVIFGVAYAITGSVPLELNPSGVVIATIAIAVVAVVAVVCFIYQAMMWSVNHIVSVIRSESSDISENLLEAKHSIESIENTDKNTKYIVAAILAATMYQINVIQRSADEPKFPASAPPYVTAARIEMAAEVARQRLVGNAHAEAILYTAGKFGQTQEAISDAWGTDGLEAVGSVLDEIDSRNWKLTEETRPHLSQIFSDILPETLSGELILKRFHERARSGAVLKSLCDEAKAIYGMPRSNSPSNYSKLLCIELLLRKKHNTYWAKQAIYESSILQTILEIYKKAELDLGLYRDLFTG